MSMDYGTSGGYVESRYNYLQSAGLIPSNQERVMRINLLNKVQKAMKEHNENEIFPLWN